MTDESSGKRKAHMAGLLTKTPDLAPKGVIEVGYMIHDFLAASVADAGTGVDFGAGMGAFDLWVKSGGHEYLVTVKHGGQCRNATHLFDQCSPSGETPR